MKFRGVLLSLVYIFCLFFNPTWAGLDSNDVKQLFVSDIVYKSLPPVIQDAWKTIKKAHDTGQLKSTEFEKSVLWEDIILKKMKSLHDDLKIIDQVVEDHRPAKHLNEIVNLLELKKLMAATKKVSTSKEVSLLEFWKEGWVKLSSMFIQLHYKYDWIFSHVYKEGYPENLNHELMDDILTLMDFPDHHALPYKNRLHYVWMRLTGNDRGQKWEQFVQTLDEVAGYAKIVTTGSPNGKDLTNNMFVGLRILLNMHPEIVGPYKDPENETDPCEAGGEYGGTTGVNYHIPVYVLMYILNAEMKYYLLKNFAEMQKCVHLGKCNFGMVGKLEKHLKVYYTFYFEEMINAFKVNDDPLKNAPPNAWRWRCDPKELKEDDNYARFYDFDTHFMAEERAVSLTQTCRDSCDMFDGAFSTIPCENQSWDCLETDDDFDCWERHKSDFACPAPARKLCPNEGLQCTTTKIQEAHVCPGDDRDHRYISWIYTDGKKLKNMGRGAGSNCTHDMEAYDADQAVERSGITKFEPQQCEVCLCRCYEPLGNKTHRYLSLLPQMTDISKGRIIGGVRFVKIKDVIYISIADADLTENGRTKGETLEWKEPTPVDVTKETEVFRLARDARTILLDNLVAPLGYVVTGIRLKPTYIPFDRMFVKEVMLQLHVTRMKEGGGLDVEDSGWIYNHNDSRFRSEIFLENSDVPNLVPGPSKPISHSNDFIRVQASSLLADAGQTPVPFFDTQKVSVEENSNASTVRGVGMYFKKSKNSGGFLGFRLITDLFHDLPPNDPRYDLWHQIELEDVRKGGTPAKGPSRPEPKISESEIAAQKSGVIPGGRSVVRLTTLRPVTRPASELGEDASDDDDIMPEHHHKLSGNDTAGVEEVTEQVPAEHPNHTHHPHHNNATS